jgi:hypothetical protein
MRAGDVDRLGGVVVAWYVGSDYRPTRRAAEGCERVKHGQSSKGLQVLRNQIDVKSDLPEILCISVERLVKLRNTEKVQTCHRENTPDMILLRTSVISNAFNVVQRDKAS